MGIKVSDSDVQTRLDQIKKQFYASQSGGKPATKDQVEKRYQQALKIDLHRRLALTESEDDLRELHAGTEDRYGPLPEPVENLFAIQEAKLKLARLGADYLVFRGGRAAVGPVELGSGELRALRGRVETAVYTTARREVSLRDEEFDGAIRLVDAMLETRQAA